jgi:hypothetical protein
MGLYRINDERGRIEAYFNNYFSSQCCHASWQIRTLNRRIHFSVE